MKKKKIFLKTAKKTIAFMLAVSTFVLNGYGLDFSKQTANVVKAEAASTDVLSGEDRNVIFANSRTDFRDESIYFTMVTRYYNGDESNDVQCWDGTQYNLDDPAWRGDFKGLIEKLDYIKSLGFTAIWITPVVENCSGYDYHGYHAINFSKVDPRYESDDCTYQDLIDEVHARGMKIIQDVVFNHTGNFGEENLIPMFKKEGDLSSPDCLQVVEGSGLPSNYDSLTPARQYAARLALMKNTDGVNHDVNNLFHHYGNFNWDDYTCQIAQIAGDCVDLNTENPIVYNYLVDAYSKYIDMGVDGFRVDTVRHISRLTFNKVFNDAFIEAGKRNGKDFYMFGEVCTRDNGNYWYRQSPSMSTPFYTWKESKDYEWSDTDWQVNYDSAIQATIDNAANISEQPTSQNALLNGNSYHTPDYSEFSGLNVIDFPMHWSFKSAQDAFSVAVRGDEYYNDATWNVTYVDSHDYAPDGAPEDKRFDQSQSTWAENLSLMFTFRGIPCIYYGTETEFQKGATIDKGPNIALADTGRAYYGDNIEGTVTAVGFGEYGNVSGPVGDTLKHPLSQHIQRLNRLRQAIPALRKGQYSTEGCSGSLSFKRRYTDDKTDSFCLVSISGDSTFTGIPNGTYVDAVTGTVKNVTDGTLTATVSGQGNLAVYVLDTNETPAPGRVITNGKYLTDGGEEELIQPIAINVVDPTDIKLNKTSVSLLEGNVEAVTANVSPADATYKTVSWSSSNNSVATVSGGRITGVGKGSAVITAKTVNGLTATVNVTVAENPNIIKPTGISVDKTSVILEEGNTEKITATVSPANATNKTVKWSSDNTQVATVSNAGIITAVRDGSANITVTTFNGYEATIKVYVTAKQIPVITNGIYFKKPDGWGSDINIYMFSGSKSVGKAWPGSKMIDLGDGIYGYEYTSTDKELMVIFSDGNGNQTADFEFVNSGYYDVSGYIKTVDTNGVVYFKYVDTEGNILDIQKLSGKTGEKYTSEAKTFNGYKLQTIPENASGTFGDNTTEVIYVYTKTTSDAKSGWVNTGDSRYYYEDGKVVTGWKSINGKQYYFNTSGVMQTSKWISGKYYVKADGTMATSEFVDNNKYYVDANGKWVKSTGLIKINSKMYYFSNGVVQTSTWKKVGGKWYYFDTSGVMQTSKWISSTYYVKADGTMATSEFVDNNKCYVDANGKWVQSTQWLEINSKRYYMTSGNIQQSKWVKINNKWYYFDTSGVMQTSKWISGQYYVKSDGKMATSEWVDGGKYYVGSDGKWIKGYQK